MSVCCSMAFKNAVARVAGDTMTLTEKVAKSVVVHRIPCVLIVMPTVQSSSIDFRTEQLFRGCVFAKETSVLCVAAAPQQKACT
jgi:hypothetical protein